MAYIKRAMESVFMGLSKEYPAILITGPRQVGKTTMLKKMIEQEGINRTYVTLDDLNERKLAVTDPALFFQLHKPPVFIDEIQYAPELFPYIKMIADENMNPGAIWMTGSQIFKLMAGVRESLAGRVAILHLSPLSQSEIFDGVQRPFKLELEYLSDIQKNAIKAYATEIFDRIFTGGMPALVSGKYKDRDIFYSSYISTYLERDVKELSGSIDSLKFIKFVTAVAARSSQMVNFKSIADDSDIDQKTAKSWLGILETLGIIFYLYPYSNNVLKRTVKTPKIYFYDTGLICYLTKWSSTLTVMNGAMNGALLENYVISEIKKSYQNNGKEPYLYYYRDKDGNEIDLIIEADGKIHPIEIKKTAIPDTRLIRMFSVLDNKYLNRGTGAVICLADKLGAINKENLIIPIYLI